MRAARLSSLLGLSAAFDTLGGQGTLWGPAMGGWVGRILCKFGFPSPQPGSVGSERPSPRPPSCGVVPQRLAFSPLLFNIYVQLLGEMSHHRGSRYPQYLLAMPK